MRGSNMSGSNMSSNGMSRRVVARVARAAWALSAVATGLGCGAGGSGTTAPIVEIEPGVVAPPPPAQMTNTPPGTGGTGGDFIVDPGDVPVAMETPTAPVLAHRNLIGKQVSCDGGGTTTVSGTVFIPSGQLPLYNVMVYVPETELGPMPAGASCGCEISGEPIVSALTDSSGHFVLENVPVGPDIPVVIQVGDWRREINIGTVEPCVETAVADGMLRMPAKKSEGDMPTIAVATGRLDALECLVRKLGVDESEFTNSRDGGRVNLFSGYGGSDTYAEGLNGGEEFPPAQSLWDTPESLARYDIVLLSCEGDREHLENKPPNALQAMYDYANLGGRVFASHFHGVWFQQGPAEFPNIADFTDEDDDEFSEVTAQVVTDFPKGQALHEWIVNTGASTDGEVPIRGGAHTIVQENTDYAQRWLDTGDPASVQYISANTPLGASDDAQCGRVVLSDIHVSPGPPDSDYSSPQTRFPDGCITDTLSPQEAVLAFMLFDLSACIVPDNQAPTAPPILR